MASFLSSKVPRRVVSTFRSYNVLLWSTIFLETSLTPFFDGRIVLHPSWRNIHDYVSWRQIDCDANSQLCWPNADVLTRSHYQSLRYYSLEFGATRRHDYEGGRKAPADMDRRYIMSM